MKRTLLSLAVVAASGSVNAAEIYSMDGVTVDISGEVEINYIKTQAKTQDSELTVEEGNFGLDASYEMTEDFSVGSSLSFDANNDTDDVTRGDVYISLIYQQAHTLTLGQQSTILDDAGIGDDYSFGFTSFVDSLTSDGDQVIKYKYDGGEMFYAGIAYSDYANKEATATVSDEDYEVDGKIGARINDFDYTLYVARGEHVQLDETTVALEGRYTMGDVILAGTYATSTAEEISGIDTDIDMFGLAVTYWDGGRMEYAAGWANIDNNTKSRKINDFYVNATFSLSDEVSAFAEVGFTDEDNTDTGYVVGINASF